MLSTKAGSAWSLRKSFTVLQSARSGRPDMRTWRISGNCVITIIDFATGSYFVGKVKWMVLWTVKNAFCVRTNYFARTLRVRTAHIRTSSITAMHARTAQYDFWGKYSKHSCYKRTYYQHTHARMITYVLQTHVHKHIRTLWFVLMGGAALSLRPSSFTFPPPPRRFSDSTEKCSIQNKTIFN